ncbi:MAG TPA: adenylate/guanylate cyclase domain-containing protein [Rectinemataceae bacterium]|nr:adenylate/guanylate cyclase domain-containing protein [Rectinemataceae bacterium]
MNRFPGPDRPPRFKVLGVMLPGLMLYIALSLFFGFYFVFADQVKRDFGAGAKAVLDLAEGRMHPVGLPRVLPLFALDDLPSAGKRAFLDLAAAALVLAMAGTALFHAPLVRYFALLREGEGVPETLRSAARSRIFRSPGVMALAAPAFIVPLGIARFAAGQVFGGESMMLPIEGAVLALSSLFTFLWQRHRVQAHYLPRLFSRDELAARVPGGHRSRVRGDFLLLVSISTILPLVVVALFVGTGLSFAGTVSSLKPDQIRLLFGGELGPAARSALERLGGVFPGGIGPSSLPVYFMGPLDLARVVSGLVIGLAIILVYVFFIARWTAADIVVPVEALRANMDRAREGDLEALTPALTTNELGDLTVGFNDMLRGIAERERIKALFGQYLTKEISEAILDGRVNLSGARYEATVMFTDIRGFTAMSERLEPEEVFAFLNDYLGRMIEVIAARGGIIDKFLGDGILAVFGLPVPSADHAASAVGAALDMRARLAELNEERARSGREAVRIGIGMHSGQVIAGNVGSRRKLQYTVIGDAVNVASRLEGLNKEYGSYLLMSGATHELLGEAAAGLRFDAIRGVEIRGKTERLDLYRLVDD